MVMCLLVRVAGSLPADAMISRGAHIVLCCAAPEKVRVMSHPSDPAQISQADLAAMRHDYAAVGLDVAACPPEPIALWQLWLADAMSAALAEVNAMVLSTVNAAGAPSSRMVLCKHADADGFVFYTNYGSSKAVDIAANPQVSLLFPWHPLGRQVRVDGTAARVPREESAAYFATRPRGAQLGAWASRQSSVLATRDELEQRSAEAAARFADGDVPLPPHWGGYRVTPTTVEFWQGRADRMHDRLRYRRTGSEWVVERLNP
jgi:pyridoxamine 5'-phosphate oxidase